MSARRVAAIGILAALAYSGSFLLMAIPNVTLAIVLVFFAGYYLERFSGALVGLISALLISLFNPYGLVPLPLLLAQILGYVLIGLLGALAVKLLPSRLSWISFVWLTILGVVTALLYMVPVSVADAYLFGPFWERLALSAPFILVTVGSNVIFFLLVFPVLANIKKLGIFRVT